MYIEGFGFKKLLKTLDNLPGTILIVDKNMKITYFNKIVCEIFKTSPDKLIGSTMDMLLEQGILINSPTKESFSTKKLTIDYVKGVMDVPILTYSTPILNENGDIEYVIALSIDEILVEHISKLMVDERYNSGLLLDYLSQNTGMNVPVVAESHTMKELLSFARKVSATDSTVLLTGETGTGKEVVAKYIHNNSMRSSEVFISVNCAAIPNDLMESEFFGYNSGAFTGANKEGKAGFFELADHGTLFLDEIGEMPIQLQSKFLRILETGEVKRLGAEISKKIDIRLIAATNRDLYQMCHNGTFREDLYYRLNVIPIKIPPLRERPDDILPLAKSILSEFNKKYNVTKIFSHETIKRLMTYNWPGNVRELRNVIERLILVSDSSILDFSTCYPFNNDKAKESDQNKNANIINTLKTSTDSADGLSLREKLNAYEKHIILTTLDECDGNVAKAAETLKIHKSALYRKIDTLKNKKLS